MKRRVLEPCPLSHSPFGECALCGNRLVNGHFYVLVEKEILPKEELFKVLDDPSFLKNSSSS